MATLAEHDANPGTYDRCPCGAVAIMHIRHGNGSTWVHRCWPCSEVMAQDAEAERLGRRPGSPTVVVLGPGSTQVSD